MTSDLLILLISTISISFFHALLGPDHYLPFIVMAKSGKWSLLKTASITTLCGIGHVLSSVFFGFIGIFFGISLTKIEFLESSRGNLAAWALIAFGTVYLIWGIRNAIKNKTHKHFHVHEDGNLHEHLHTHNNEHMHVHEESKSKSMTPWVLFTIFLFGPCEPLIPLLMYPAAKNSYFELALVIVAFTVVTIFTMLGIVLISTFGISFIPLSKLERFSHAMAGFTVLSSGLAIQFLGL